MVVRPLSRPEPARGALSRYRHRCLSLLGETDSVTPGRTRRDFCRPDPSIPAETGGLISSGLDSEINRRDRTTAWRPETPLMLSMMSVCRGTASAVGPSRGNDSRRGFSSFGGLRQCIEGSALTDRDSWACRSLNRLTDRPRLISHADTPRPEPCPGRAISALIPRTALTGFRLLPTAPRRAPTPGLGLERGRDDSIRGLRARRDEPMMGKSLRRHDRAGFRSRGRPSPPRVESSRDPCRAPLEVLPRLPARLGLGRHRRQLRLPARARSSACWGRTGRARRPPCAS